MPQQIIDGQLFDTFLVRGEGEEGTVPVELSSEVEIRNDEGNAIPVEPLGIPTVARQLTVTDVSTSIALSLDCTRVSIYARSAAIRFVVGTGTQTATATSHFLDASNGMDFRVPLGATLAAIRAGDTNAILEISEISGWG